MISWIGSSGGRLTPQEALPTTKRVELVGKKEFAAAALDPERETFVVYVASLTSADIQVFIRCAQIDVSSRATHLDAQNELINRLIN